MIAVSGRVRGKAAYLGVNVTLPPVLPPEQPTMARVVKAKAVAVEVGEEFTVARVRSVKVWGLFLLFGLVAIPAQVELAAPALIAIWAYSVVGFPATRGGRKAGRWPGGRSRTHKVPYAT